MKVRVYFMIFCLCILFVLLLCLFNEPILVGGNLNKNIQLGEEGICFSVSLNVTLPFYYSKHMVFQMAPSPHMIWGFANDTLCPIRIKETCSDGYGMY